MLKFKEQTKKTILILIGSLSSACVLICALFVLAYSDTDPSFGYLRNLGFATFALLAVSRVPIMFRQKTKINLFKNIAFAGTFLFIAILYAACPITFNFCISVSILFGVIILANRITYLIDNHTKKHVIAINAISIVFASIYILISFAMIGSNAIDAIVMMLFYIIASISLIDVIRFAFLQIKLKVLFKIIRKTYALEILYGLFILLFCFSFVFYLQEPSIVTYADALWYSFSIITTIGFGDFSAITPLGRILSVVLGLYGIIVVALLTSIIVNFYNEISKNKDEEKGGFFELEEEKYDVEVKEVKKEEKKKDE